MLRVLVTLLVFAALGVLLALGANRLVEPRVEALGRRLSTVREELADARLELERLDEPSTATVREDFADERARIDARARRRLAGARVRTAALALDAGLLDRAAELLESERAAGWELDHLRLRLERAVTSFAGHELLVNDVDLAGDRVVSAGADGTVRVWDLASGEALAVLRSESQAYLSVATSADLGTVAAGDEDGFVCLWDPGAARLLARFDAGGGPVRALELSADGSRLTAGGVDGVVRVFDRSGSSVAAWSGHDGEINGLAITPDGSRVLSGSDDATAILWRVGEAEPEQVLVGHEGWIRAVALGPDGLGATASDDRTIRVWDLERGESVAVLEGHRQAVLDVRFLADGHRLLSCSDDATIRLWDRHASEELEVFRWTGATVERVLATADRAHVVFTTYDERVRTWNREPESGRVELDAGLGELRAVAAREGVVVVGGSLGRVRVFDARGGPAGDQASPELEVGVAAVTALAISPDAREIAVALADRTVVRVARADGTRVARFDGFGRPVRSLAYVGDEELAAIGEDGEVARLTADGPGERSPGPRTQLLGVALAPDGSRAAWADAAGTVRVRSTVGGEVLAGSRIDRFAKVGSLALSPGGNALFLGLQEGTVARFDLDEDRPPVFFVGHERGVTALAQDASGERLASAGRDRTVRLWDADTGDVLLTLVGPRAQVTSLCFDAASGALIAACADGRLIVWPSRAESLRAWRTLR